jgi:acetyl esterase/lipase
MHCVLVSYYRSNHFLVMILKKIFVLSTFAIFSLSSFARENVSPDEVLEYKDTPQGKLFLHTYFPDNWKKTDKRPAVVFFFGGGWNGGSYTQFSRHADYLASRGMVAFAADYRTKSKHMTEPKACVSDGKSAVRWIRGNAAKLGVDPEKIIAGGGSAGGHVAATTATIQAFDESSDDLSISPKPQALLLFNPVIDNSEKGYGYSRVEAYWKEFSPLHNIKKGIPPTIFICGTKDNLIPVATGELFKKKIEKVGRPLRSPLVQRCQAWFLQCNVHGDHA